MTFNPRDPHQIAANSQKRVLFLSWEDGVDKFEYYSPCTSQKDYASRDKYDNEFTKTVFIPGGDQAVTGTNKGDIIVWDKSLIIEGIGEQNEKRLIKVVTLNNDKLPSINILTVHHRYLVVGNQNGTIRFYDLNFKIEAWFEDFNLSVVKAVSFSASAHVRKASDNSPFECCDFLVSDSSGQVLMLNSTYFEEIDPKKKLNNLIMDGIKSAISCLAVHPTKPLLAIGGEKGFILLWNYMKQKFELHNYKYIDGDEPRTMVFTPSGDELIVGQTKGLINILDANDQLKKKTPQPLKASEDKQPVVNQIVVSDCGEYFASMDSFRCVCLFRKGRMDPSKPIEWLFNGKVLAHNDQITGICFGEGLGDNSERKLYLFSVSRDRTVVEYDIAASSLQLLVIKKRFSVENESRPSACIWYPKVELKSTQEDLGEGKQNLLLTVNDDYKAKLWNINSRTSRRTCLGPTYGGEIVKMKLLNIQNNSDKFIIYSTKEKVMGLMKMPLDGNPNKTMGLIAHPKKIVDMCASADGKYLFTCGGDDLAINMWSIDVTPIDQAIALGGEGIVPFVNLIEGGRDGKAFQDIKDFFYYSMIRSKDENTTKTRKLNGTVPLKELPNLMRAMGYYPTEMEVQNMKDEV